MVDFLTEFAAVGEEKGEGVLGNGRVVDPGAEGDGDPFGGGELDVDLIQADPVFRNQLQAGKGLLDHPCGDCVVPSQKSVEVPGQLEHSFLVERTALAHDLKSLRLEKIMVFAGGILV